MDVERNDGQLNNVLTITEGGGGKNKIAQVRFSRKC